MTTMLNGESKFWTTNLGRIVPIFTMVAALLGVYLANDRRIAKSENNIEVVTHSVVEVNGAVKQLADQIRRMDSEGTHSSQRGIMQDTSKSAENSRRIDQLEVISAAMGPKVERIDTNLDWITKWIQGQETARKK